MEVALRRRLAGVTDVSISQREQTAAVTFAARTLVFSAADFRRAIAEADVTVLTIDVTVCGVIETGNVLRVSSSNGAPTLQLRGASAVPGDNICITGRLRDEPQPYEVEVTQLRPTI